MFYSDAQSYVLRQFSDLRRGSECAKESIVLYFVSLVEKTSDRLMTVPKISYFDRISLTIEKSATLLRATFDESSWARVATTSQKLLSLRGSPSL